MKCTRPTTPQLKAATQPLASSGRATGGSRRVANAVRWGLGCCALVSATLAQPAANSSTITALDEITVTATRISQDVFSVPYSAHVLKRVDFLERQPARTLPDALAETPGVMVQKTSYGQASPFIRGFTGFRTLMLIDGIRLNNAVFRDGPNQYWGTTDLLTVDRLEIVKGPSSVLYGSDAVGGTVNLFTLAPLAERMTAGLPAGARSSAYYRYSSAEDSHVVRGQAGLGLTSGFGILAGATHKRFADLRGGDATGVQLGSGYRETDADVKLQFRPLPNLEITSAYYRVRQDDVPRTHATAVARSFAGTVPGNDLRRDLDQARDLAYVQSTLRRPIPALSKAQVSVSWHRQAEEQDRIRSNRRREITGFIDEQWGAMLHLESPSPFGVFSYGAEFYRDAVDSHGTDTPNGGATRVLPRGSVADDAGYDLVGLYLQSQFRLGGKSEVTTGLRYARAVATARQVDPDPTDAVVFGPLNRSSDAVTASVRMRHSLSPRWNLFGGISQGFRAPNLSDFTSFELARSGERETPAPGLRPEKYVSSEIGTKARIEGIRTEFYGAIFHTLIRNQISRFPTGRMIDAEREVTKANTGEGEVRGFEVGTVTSLGWGFMATGSLTWLRGEVDNFVTNSLVREPLSRIQPLTGHLGLRWRSAQGAWWGEAVATLTSTQSRLSSGDIADIQRIPPGGTPGYSVYSLRGGWRINSWLTFTAAVENLLNADYRTHGSGMNEPGFNLVTSLRVGY